MLKRISARIFPSIMLGLLAMTAVGQSVPSAEIDSPKVVAGAGISDFYLDYGHGRRMIGIDAWVQWNPQLRPRILQRLSLQLEARDINYDRPSSLTKMRQDTGMIGLNGRLYRYHRALFYGKALAGLGSIDFPPPAGYRYYTHDTRNIWVAGVGMDYKLSEHLLVRGDYEYQWWPNLFGRNHALTPNGITVGVGWAFGRLHQ